MADQTPTTRVDDISWMSRGRCRTHKVDPALFFPEEGSANPARSHCARCVVKSACLAYAMEHMESGVWGGTTDYQRNEMRAGRAS